MTDQDAMVAVDVVVAAAGIVRERFGGVLGRIDKGDDDFATDADLAAEAAMREILQARRPDDGIVGEEAGRSGPANASKVWLLDPLCGTMNYAAGTPLVAVNAALVEGGRTIAAAVADPFGDEVCWTDGTDAWSERRSGRTRATPTAASRLLELDLDPPFPNASWFSAARLAADGVTARDFRPRVLSTTLGLTWVATGHRAAYVTDGDVRGSVHFTAGIALCAAAGCVVTDLDGDDLHGPDGLVVAADEETHARLLALVRRQRR